MKNAPISSTSSSQQSSEDFIHSEAVVEQLNETSSNLKLNISPIKMPQSINIKMRESYALRKRKQINDAFDSQIASKMMKVYDITDLPALNENNECKTNDKWLENIIIALDNCSNFLEKVRLLSIIPSDISKDYLLSVLPNVTIYMIDQARSLVNNKKIYKQSENYCGHSLDS
ncbi:hypothetical protein [Escherichia coli]|uniref:hypothetical protein n=1 Tax=Escherichia coli TaxID=562 RepID=UPI002915FC60|nr:hypothetical protein [Escherichia coli]